MRPNPVVVLHGWHDDSSSFKPLATFLESQDFDVVEIFLADYFSLHDEITIQDLGLAFIAALDSRQIRRTRHAFDCIVHSTGGLVVREFLRQVCKGDPTITPIQNLLMYSPANFGSPLAAQGKSVLGRLFKGWSWDTLGQTGTQILNALELASPYSWDLGLNDRLNPAFDVFSLANTLTTIVGGTAAYPGLASVVHEDGSDGTVRVSTASLNVALVRIDCDTIDPTQPPLLLIPSAPIALAVLNRDHSDTHNPDPALSDFETWKRLTLEALNSAPALYPDILADCAKVATDTFATGLLGPNPDRYQQYQTIVVHLHDQFGAGIPDYVIEFYQEANDPNDSVFRAMHGGIIEKVTTNTTDASFRSFLINTDLLQAYLAKNPTAQIELSVTAAAVSKDIQYRNPARGISIFTGPGKALLMPNAPLFLDITLYRISMPEVFVLNPAT